MREFFDPAIEDTNIVLVDEATIRHAERRLRRCEACSDEPQLLFNTLLDQLTGHDPRITDYLLSRPANCPKCHSAVTEKTIVEWKQDDENGNTEEEPTPVNSQHA